MVMAVAPQTPVFYLDTGFLFPETYALVETVALAMVSKFFFSASKISTPSPRAFWQM